MKSIIEEIYFGKRGQIETIKASEAYWRVHEKAEALGEELEKSMTEEQIKIFREYFYAVSGLEAEQSLTHFKEGVKLGMLLAFEVFA